MDSLNSILSNATAHIDDMYIHLHLDGGDAPIYRERVYCYELYHQMRLLWPQESEYYLNGEVDKAAHPILRELDADNAKPDLLVHKPGYMAGNYAVIEIKHFPAAKQGIIKDLQTLNKFMSRVKYQRGIYLLYGDVDSEDVKSKVFEIASEININLSKLEVWYHREASKPAEQLSI